MVGKRARSKAKTVTWEPKKGDRVVATMQGEEFRGEVFRVDERGVVVDLDDGDRTSRLPLTAVAPEIAQKELVAPVIEEPEDKGKKGKRDQSAVDEKSIIWDKTGVNFKVDTDDKIHFYGWHRNARNNRNDELFHAIDIFAIKDDKTFAVNSIAYHEDPRFSIRSLNADICAALNRWFFQRCNGDAQHLDDLMASAKNPTLHITRLETIDRMMMKLREFRDTAIKVGGTRILQLTGDREGDATFTFSVDLTSQAIGLKGKIPSLNNGAAFDDPTMRRTSRGTRSIVNIPDQSNVQALIERLEASKDKAEQRKLRATLRKMGHRGGARAIRARLEGSVPNGHTSDDGEDRSEGEDGNDNPATAGTETVEEREDAGDREHQRKRGKRRHV